MNLLRMAPGPVPLCCLLLVCVLPSVKSCLQCDRKILHTHEDFITSKKMTVQQQIDLKKNIDNAYNNYKEISRGLSGLIDPTTLYRVQTEYQSEFKRHWQSNTASGSIQQDLIKILEKGNRILKKHLEDFVATGLCPNTCGVLFQSVMNCSSCQYGTHRCQPKTLSCGEHYVNAFEKEQVVLDCFLPWHSLIVGHVEYHYSLKRRTRTFSEDGFFEVLVVTQDSKIVLNQLGASDQGLYRCRLQDKHGTTLSSMLFVLGVYGLPSTTLIPIPTLPTIPGMDAIPGRLHRDTLIIIHALLTALSFLASIAIIGYFRMMLRRRKHCRER